MKKMYTLLILMILIIFISCQGPMGPMGLPGVDGEDGEDGEDGVDGIDGEDGEDALVKLIFNSTDYYSINDLAYSSDKIIAVGVNQTIILSDDGVNWYQPDSYPQTEANLTGVAYGNGVFVIVDQLGKIHRSTDSGSTWTTIPTENNLPLNSITYGINKFIAVGGDAENSVILLSNDYGLTWSSVYAPVINSSIDKINFTNGIFFTCGQYSGYSRIHESFDGINWIEPEGNVIKYNTVLSKVYYGNGAYMVADNYGAIYFSLDGVFWEDFNLTLASDNRGFVYGKNCFALLTYDSNNYVYKIIYPYSPNTWLFPITYLPFNAGIIICYSLYYIPWLNEGSFIIFLCTNP